MSDFWTPLQPLTVIGIFVIGVALGVFLWITERRVTFSCVVHVGLPGTAFLVYAAVSREVDRPGALSFYAGIVALWLLYLATAFGSVMVWRRLHRGGFQ
jgi:hypothetical protein